MTQDEIIEMAKQAGWEMDDSLVLEPEIVWYICQEQLENFAKLVAQHEREACIELTDSRCQCAWAIQERGQA
jgi:hypothetical protein